MNSTQLWLFREEPWEGRSPRELTKVAQIFKFAEPARGSILDAPWSFKVPEGDPLQLEMFDGA